MNLLYIKTERCPVCDAEPNAESHDRPHCNGERREHRAFTCGHVVEYSPNFSRERVVTACPSHLPLSSKNPLARPLSWLCSSASTGL